MIYGLAGASGTGKTTLAEAISEQLDMKLVKTSITDMSRKEGFSPVERLTIHERITLQKGLFRQFEELLRNLQGPAILDRTPLDLIMYMLAEIDMNSADRLSNEDMEWARDYIGACQALTELYFDHVFVTPPLDFYESAATRPGYNPAYQAHCHLLMMGSLFDMKGNLDFSILRSPDLTDRIDYLTDTIVGRLDHIEQSRRSSLHIH